MTVSAGADLSPARTPLNWRVYKSSVLATYGDNVTPQRADNRDLGAPQWEEDTRLRVERVVLTSGATPSGCLLSMPANEAGAGTTKTGLVWGTDLDNRGQAVANVMRPDGLYLWDDVKVTLGSDTVQEVCPFRGYVVQFYEDFGDGRVYIMCADGRAILAGMPLHGVMVWDARSEAYVWDGAQLPVFNHRGVADCADGVDTLTGEALHSCFTHLGGEDAVPWSRGKVWNYIERYWQSAPPATVRQSTAGWLEIPRLAPDGTGKALFALTTSSGDKVNAWPQLALGGQKLNKALATLARGRGNHDLTTEHEPDKSYLVLYATGADGVGEQQEKVNLVRGEIADKVTASRGAPDVVGNTLGYDGRRAYTAIRMLGARKELDVSFDTYAGTLAAGWLDDDEALYQALADADKRKGKKLSSVYRRYVIPDTLDWRDDYALVVPLLRARGLGAALASTDSATAGATGRGVRIRAQAWYSTDGVSWTLAPHSVVPQADSLAVEFENAARWGDDKWTINGSYTERHVRITVKLVLDERLAVTDSFEPAGWPVLEHLLIDDDYKYRARRKAYLRSSGGSPVMDGGTAAEYGALLNGAASDDEIRDDTDYMQAAAYGLRDQLSRAHLHGDPQVVGIRTDLRPGVVVEKILGGGPDGADVTRPDWPINAVIRRVVYDVRADRTTISFRGD